MLGLFHSQIEPKRFRQLFTYPTRRQWSGKGVKKGRRAFSVVGAGPCGSSSSRDNAQPPDCRFLPPAALAGPRFHEMPQAPDLQNPRPPPPRNANRDDNRAPFSNTAPGHGRPCRAHRWRGGFTPTTEPDVSPEVGPEEKMSEPKPPSQNRPRPSVEVDHNKTHTSVVHACCKQQQLPTCRSKLAYYPLTPHDDAPKRGDRAMCLGVRRWLISFPRSSWSALKHR